jgi:folate-binding protein YgfZ
VDLTTDSLPHEAPLDEAIAFDKGCYLGQEAVAKVRNLGHPPYVLLPVRIDGPAAPGDEVHADGDRAGTVTSAAPEEDGTAAIIRIRWASRDRSLATASGAAISAAG